MKKILEAGEKEKAGLDIRMKQNKLKWIGNILTIAAVCFLINYFRDLDIDFQILLSGKMLTGILAGGIFSLGAVLLSAWAWKNTVAFFSEKKILFREAAKVYMQANLGKYIPGNIAHFVERNMFAAKAGIGHTETAMGTFLEIACLLVAAALLGMVLSFQDVCAIVHTFFSVNDMAGMAGLLVAGMIVLWILCRKLAWIRMLLHKMKRAAFWKTICLNLLLYLATMLLLAGLMCLFVLLLNETIRTVRQVRIILTVYILSWAAGYIMPGAPGGIGVREAAITYLTRNHPLQEAILLAMVLHRVSTVLGDIFGYLWAKSGLLL